MRRNCTKSSHAAAPLRKYLPEIVETEMLATENIFFVSDKNFFDACNNNICEVITSIVNILVQVPKKMLLLSSYPQRYQQLHCLTCAYNCMYKKREKTNSQRYADIKIWKI
jgi:hypothetical protein